MSSKKIVNSQIQKYPNSKISESKNTPQKSNNKNTIKKRTHSPTKKLENKENVQTHSTKTNKNNTTPSLIININTGAKMSEQPSSSGVTKEKADSHIIYQDVPDNLAAGLNNICNEVKDTLNEEKALLLPHIETRQYNPKDYIQFISQISKQNPEYVLLVVDTFLKICPTSRSAKMITRAINENKVISSVIFSAASHLQQVHTHNNYVMADELAATTIQAATDQYNGSNMRILEELPEKIDSVLLKYTKGFEQLQTINTTAQGMLSTFQTQCNNTLSTMNDIATKYKEIQNKTVHDKITINTSSYRAQPTNQQPAMNTNMTSNSPPFIILPFGDGKIKISSDCQNNVVMFPTAGLNTSLEPFMTKIARVKEIKYNNLKIEGCTTFIQFLDMNVY